MVKNMDIKKTLDELKQKFSQTSDLITREFSTNSGEKVAIVFLDNIVDQLLLATSVIKPLQNLESKENTDLADIAMQQIIAFSQVKEAKDLQELTENLLSGFCGVIFTKNINCSMC